MQQNGFSETFWIKVVEVWPLAVTATIGALVTMGTGIASVIQNWRLKKQQNTIRENTDGKLTEILSELEDALGRNIQLEKELKAAYAILSAREGRPVLKAIDVARAEDFGLPPRGNGGTALHQRRHGDHHPPEERRKDDDTGNDT